MGELLEDLMTQDHIETSAPHSLTEAGSRRVHSVDILRALAALAVVLYHARKGFSIGLQQMIATYGFPIWRPDILLSYASSIFAFGWLGVPVFFVLSGYCIHRGYAMKLARAGDTQLAVLSFYKRRFVRIYPVYLGALLLSGMVAFLTQTDRTFFPWLIDNFPQFLLNLMMGQELLTSSFGNNGVFWTLSIEFHLYLFYPVVFLLIRRFGPLHALGVTAAISLAIACLYCGFNLSRLFIHAKGNSPLFLSHLFLWTSGAYLAEIHTGRAQAPKGAMWHLTWMSALVIAAILPQPASAAWAPMFLAVGGFGLVSFAIPAVQYLCRRDTKNIRALYLLGVASYSLYATHVPVFGVIKLVTDGYQSASVLWVMGCVGIAISFALIFFQLIERHTIRAPFDPI
ncbi:MAG: acyltransferase [Sphingomonas sp.]